MKNIIISLIFLFLSGNIATAQQLIDTLMNDKPKTEWFLSTQLHYGWLWKHRDKIKNLPTVYPYAWELDMVAQTKGTKEWHWANNMPRLGFQLLFINLRNLEIYGNAIHTTPYVDLILARGDKSELFIKLGLGLAFYSNTFHIYRNQQNEIISSPASYSGTFGFSYKRPFIKNTNMIMAANFNHASNATIRQPNLGSNILSASFAVERRTLGYRHFEERLAYKKWRKTQDYKAIHFFFFPSIAIKQSDGSPRQDVWYPMYNLAGQAMFRLRRKLGITLGFDFTNDESLRHVLANNHYYKLNRYPIHRYAVLAGYEYIFSEKVYGSLQTAYYLYDPYNLDFPLYQRYGLKIFPTKHLMTGFFLKTHLFRADGFELLAGYHLKTPMRRKR